LASGDERRSLAYNYRIGYDTVTKIFNETTRAIWQNLKDDFVQSPNCTQEWQAVARDYWIKWNFPQCLGAVDGKHVQIVVSQQKNLA